MNIRHIFLVLVASFFIFSCNNNKTPTNQWGKVYKNALENTDYQTAIVALNHLILTDTQNLKDYYDSLAVFYIKKNRNFKAGEKIVNKGLAINNNNPQLLEFKSIFLSAEGKIEESRTNLKKAHDLSKLNKHLYMYATTYVTEGNINEYLKIVNGILYNPNTKPERIEVTIDETTSQFIDIKSLLYLDKAKLELESAKSNKSRGDLIIPYLDSALKISPDYQEALYYKKQITGK